MIEHQESIKHVGDAVAVGTLAATLMSWLPSATAILTFLWVLVRLYETQTVQNLIARIRGKE